MDELPPEIQQQREQFINDLYDEFAGAYDWVDAGDPDISIGLEHLRNEETEYFNRNPLEIEMGGSLAGLSIEQVDAFHEEVTSFADKKGVAVENTAGGSETYVYTFYLHSEFLDIER